MANELELAKFVRKPAKLINVYCLVAETFASYHIYPANKAKPYLLVAGFFSTFGSSHLARYVIAFADPLHNLIKTTWRVPMPAFPS